ncbi:hypothetical protein [uncultured Methylobacterium sp.]
MLSTARAAARLRALAPVCDPGVGIAAEIDPPADARPGAGPV